MTEQHQDELNLQQKNHSNKSRLRKFGVTLIVFSCFFYGALLLVPFTNYTIGIKAVISSILVVLGEVSFWIGGFILGKEVIHKYRKYLNPLNWFKR